MDATWARRVWEGKGIFRLALWLLLLPISLCYGVGVLIRNLLYALGWLPARTLPTTVVSVGNLTVGGTGKTPTAIWLAQALGKLGYRVAILSRGYKGSAKEPVIFAPGLELSSSVGEDGDVSAAGDEPVMMARIFGLRVGVGAKRHDVGTRMVREAEVDVFVLDDGFQHRQLKRDMDLLLLGTDWNGWLLPAGPFREPRKSLRRAALYLVTGAKERWEPLLAGRPEESIFFGSLQPRGLLTREAGQWKEYPLGLLGRSRILAVSAIADPASFYRMIHDLEGEIVDTLEFPDHYSYSARDWQRINRAGQNADLIITTEKDILKLVRFPFAREKLLALRVGMVVEDGEDLVRAVEEKIRARRRES